MLRILPFAAVLMFSVSAIAQTTTQAPPTAQPAMPMHRHGHWEAMLKRRFDAANTTHDGRLTLAQAEAALAKHFDKIDTAHKGYITLDELIAYRKAHWKKMHEGQATPPG